MCCKNTNAKETHFGACCSRPDLYGIIIPGKHGKLLATLYTAGGEGPHPTVLLSMAFPDVNRTWILHRHSDGPAFT